MQGTTTLLLDGLWGRTRRYGTLRREIEAACGPAEIFHYNASGAVKLETLGERLIAEVRRRDQPVNIVAFSMGGIVVRAARMLDATLPLRRVAFMNVPHRGTYVAHLIPLRGVRQMRPGSSFMRRLEAAPWDVPTLAVWCPGDLIIVPGSSARWERANQTACCKVPAHLWPFYSKPLRRTVVSFLCEDAPSPSCAKSPACSCGAAPQDASTPHHDERRDESGASESAHADLTDRRSYSRSS